MTATLPERAASTGPESPPAPASDCSAAGPAASSADAWERPRWGDPRLPFAAILTLYAVLGFTFLGFNRTYGQMLFIVASGCALDAALHWVLQRRKVVPLSAYISCCSIALLLNYAHASWVLILPVLLTVGSKHVLTFEGRHVFNPSMFGVAASLLLTHELVTTAPAYQWAGGALTMSAFMLTGALALFVFRIGRNWLIVSFLLFYALQTALRAWIMRHHLPPAMLFIGTVASPPFFLFTFYMLTDPKTSPKTPRGQVAFAFALTLVDLYLHFKESVFTFFYAALCMAALKYAFLHARALWREGARMYLAARLTRGALAPAALALAAALGVAGLRAYERPPEVEPGFRFERLEPAHTGIRSAMGTLLTDVDPRVRHVAKWVLSVGDAVAVGDVDGDGLPDVFFTNLLKRPEDRNALYLNKGDLRFERHPMPALDRYVMEFKDIGLPSGATFVDYDGDGDLDLALAVGYGPTRLLKNLLAETGALDFVDVSEQVGLTAHTVSLGVTFFDMDQDGHLDMLVLNAMQTHLRAYGEDAPAFNIFRLPEPAYEGDRRMLAFMHNGWHDADNADVNHLYRGRPDGTFERLDAAQWGMPDTRWSLAVSTADLNRDGTTDLYIANDFGPDDVYLNRGGKGFERIQGRWFGEIGRDTYKGMNASVADFDRNGWLDVYVSNVHHALQAEGSLLWMARPGKDPFVPHFADEATQRGALNERRFGWGAGTGDLQNDGWVDIVQANGMVDDRLDGWIESGRKDYWYVNHKLMQSGPEIHTYADMWGDIRGREIYPNEARRAYLNLGSQGVAAFADVADAIGIADPDNSRGVALADLDNDGDLDLIVTNQHGEASIYRNLLRAPGEPAPANARFVGLTLVGDGQRTHRSALGSRATIRYREGAGATAAPVEQIREVGTLTGFSGQGDSRLHFGIGSYAGAIEVTVDWLGAPSEVFAVEGDRYHTLTQGTGRPAER